MTDTAPANATEGPTHCGYAAIIGAPNAGKSTLLNALIGEKISIVSSKAQTTRMRVLGIAMRERTQIVFVDTPGIFRPKRKLDRAMVAAAWEGAGDADVVILLVDALAWKSENVGRIVERLKQFPGRPAILALNKIDRMRRDRLLGIIAALNASHPFEDTFLISALTGDGVEDLLRSVAKRLPAGPWLFPEDQVSDVPLRLLAAEITREKVFRQLHEELPYAIAVVSEHWEEFDNGGVRIHQAIHVQRATQKAIVLGKGGAQIKAIGAAAREELETILQRQVHLVLHVKVEEDWPDDPERYRDLGLDPRA